jgi:hypothetical protein
MVRPPADLIPLRTFIHLGGSEMESTGAASPAQGATALTRALCALILLLMAAAAAYGASMALRYFRQIGV